MRRWGPVVLLVVVLGAGLFYWLRGRPEAVKPVATTAPTSTASAPESDRRPPSDPAEARRARDAMRAKIIEALKQRGEAVRPDPPATKEERAAKAAAPKKEGESGSSGYDADYIRQNFREDMFPLLKSCYENALHRRPTLAGKLVLDFTIVGDKDIGGVVEDADIDEVSDIKDEEMETCVRESLMTLTFDKPVSGRGYVTVKYPVAFSPGDDDGDAGAPDGGPGDGG